MKPTRDCRVVQRRLARVELSARGYAVRLLHGWPSRRCARAAACDPTVAIYAIGRYEGGDLVEQSTVTFDLAP